MSVATKPVLPARQPVAPPKPGVYEGVKNEHYQKINAMQSSGLKKLAASPLIYKTWLDTEDSETKAALMFGIAVHARLLEPERYADERLEIPGLADGAVAKTWAKHIAANPGRIILAEGWTECIERIYANVIQNLDAKEVLLDPEGISEVMIIWQDENTGLMCKALLDRVTFTDQEVVITAVKTARDISADELGRACWDFGYHLEFAHSIAAARAAAKYDERFTGRKVRLQWLNIQNDVPFDVVIDDPDEPFEAVGWAHYRELMNLAARCYLDDRWPGVAGGGFRRSLGLPYWVLARFGQGAGGGM